MTLDKNEVEHIAQLARIKLTDDEKNKFARELGEIIDYVSELDKAQTDPSLRAEADQISGLENVTREDKITPSLSNEEALKNAPDKENGFFKVKKILE